MRKLRIVFETDLTKAELEQYKKHRKEGIKVEFEPELVLGWLTLGFEFKSLRLVRKKGR